MNKRKNKNYFKNGFTLVELLVVMAILGILSSIAFGQYRNSQKKARDAQRQADLDNIARALEMYYNDNGAYPLSSNGKIFTEVEEGEGAIEIEWTGPFQEEIDSQTIVYMKRLPRDPESLYSYCYDSAADGSSYALYAKLENENNSDYCSTGYSCVTETDYRYVIFSSNIEVSCP